jgi:hypothetical protein
MDDDDDRSVAASFRERIDRLGRRVALMSRRIADARNVYVARASSFPAARDIHVPSRRRALDGFARSSSPFCLEP